MMLLYSLLHLSENGISNKCCLQLQPVIFLLPCAPGVWWHGQISMNYTEAADSNTILYATSWLRLRNLKQGWNSLWLFSVKIKLATTTKKLPEKKNEDVHHKNYLRWQKYLWGKNVYIVLKFFKLWFGNCLILCSWVQSKCFEITFEVLSCQLPHVKHISRDSSMSYK